MEDDDIYGDLESSIFVESTSHGKELTRDELKEKVRELEESIEHVQEELASKDEKLKVLQQEKDSIAANISSLYATSMKMLEKKNFIIKSQIEKIKVLTSMKSKLPKNELDNIFSLTKECKSELIKMNLPEIKEAVEQSIESHLKKRRKSFKEGESKRVKYKNFSVYFHQEQVPFTRNEAVMTSNTDA